MFFENKRSIPERGRIILFRLFWIEGGFLRVIKAAHFYALCAVLLDSAPFIIPKKDLKNLDKAQKCMYNVSCT